MLAADGYTRHGAVKQLHLFANLSRWIEHEGVEPGRLDPFLVSPTTYRRNAARVAAAVSLKYSGGRMKPHSRNFTPSLTARR